MLYSRCLEELLCLDVCTLNPNLLTHPRLFGTWPPLSGSLQMTSCTEKSVYETLLSKIDNDQIPREYGGASEYALGEHPYEVSFADGKRGGQTETWWRVKFLSCACSGGVVDIWRLLAQTRPDPSDVSTHNDGDGSTQGNGTHGPGYQSHSIQDEICT